MKAIVSQKYGPPDVLEFKEMEKPVPAQGEVLIRVMAASVNAYDWHLQTADIFLVRLAAGFLRPKNAIPGADIAGRVEALGPGVSQFKLGDEIYGDIGAGSFAEFACGNVNHLALKPSNLSFEEAAAVPMAALTALQGLRDQGHIQPGYKVLVNGASGGVGTFAVQIAKVFGAEVTAVCSQRNLDLARSLGADHVIDYAREDFTQNGQVYDLIFAANGYHSIFAYRRSLSANGVYVMAGGKPSQMFQGLLLGPMLSQSGRKMGAFTARRDSKDLAFLAGLLQSGQIKAVIDQRFPLSQTAEALRYLGKGHARGKIVIQVA
jgi:NADPH:quinone reductase-like Zn-dependent oxidoreductase